MPGGAHCMHNRRARDCRICGACVHGVLRRLCKNGCAHGVAAAPQAWTWLPSAWQPSVVLQVSVTSGDAAAAGRTTTAVARHTTPADEEAAAVLLTLGLRDFGQQAALGSIDTLPRAPTPPGVPAVPAVPAVPVLRWVPAVHSPTVSSSARPSTTNAIAWHSQDAA
jgi:hypothetical protein